MDVFTEFRRGKTIENQELEPYTPAGSHLGQCRRRHRVKSSETRSFTTTTRPVCSEFQSFQQRAVMGRRRGKGVEERLHAPFLFRF